jgi:hypothetical protein
LSSLADTPYSLVGARYAMPCNPPKTFECFSLIEYVRRVYYGRETRLLISASDMRVERMGEIVRLHMATDIYQQVVRPAEADIALLSANHVGVVVNGGVLAAFTVSNGEGQVMSFPWRRLPKYYPDATYWRESWS